MQVSVESGKYPGVASEHQPTERPCGKLIRKILRGIIPCDGQGGWKPPAETMALLFVADRMDHIAHVIEPALAKGKWVLCDRYMYSTLAYQSLTSDHVDKESFLKWLMKLHSYAIEPDLVLVLNVDCDEAANRRECRHKMKEIYELDELQVRLAEFYRRLPKMGGSSYVAPGKHFVHIDANHPEDEVFEACVAAIEDNLRSF
jgi:dTMP kinase